MWVLVCSGAVTFASAVLAGEVSMPPEMAGLVPVKARNLDSVYLLPNTDFNKYRKVIIDPAEVAFHKDWMSNINRNQRSRRINEDDAKEIAEAARSGFADIWADAFRKAGYEPVTMPGPDVLRLSPGIANLYINAPEKTQPTGNSHTYSVDAGEATLVLQVRDSDTGATLGMVFDRARAGNYAGELMWTTRVSNRSDFGVLFRKWANFAVSGLQQLKINAPAAASQSTAASDEPPKR